MEKRELNVEMRNEIGKGMSRRLREKNFIPAVLYGPYIKKPVSLTLQSQEFTKVRHSGTNVLLTLKTNDAAVNGKMAFVKESQIHPLTGKTIHVDLYEVRMDEEIKVNVAVVLTGKPAGLADGGILQQVSRELEVRCLPNQIPDKISVDVSMLKIGDSIHVKEVTLPPGVKIIGTVNYTIAAVVMPEEEVVATPVVTPEAAAAAGTAAAPAAGAAPAAPGSTPAAPAKPGEKAAAPAKEGEKKAEAKK